MASSDKWPPVAETAGKNSGKNRSNTNMKKSTKENQQQVLSILLEMFQNNLEPDIIQSVADNCNWQLQSCVDALIGLSSTVDIHNVSGSSNIDGAQKKESYDNELESIQHSTSKKVDRSERTATKNRMDAFRDNISKLSSSYKENQQPSMNFESIWDWPSSYTNNTNNNNNNNNNKNKNSTKNNVKVNNTQFVLPQSNPWGRAMPLHSFTDHGQESDISESNQANTESTELCRLKVQYRSARSSPEDDDADVVIEEEFQDKIATPIAINVSQFLSTSSQTAPQVVQSKQILETTSTSSPPITPKRKAYQAARDRIEVAIRSGRKILILLRGLPGSGKSHEAKQLVMNIAGDKFSDHIFSTDDYFVKLGRGIFQFDGRKIDEAHIFNQTRVFVAMRKGITPIIIDNTNTQAWEMRPYAAKAVEYGYIVETLEPNTSWAFNPKELVKRNVHGVRRDKIEAMLDRFEHGITGEKLLARFSLRYPPSSNMIVESSKKIEDELSTNLPATNNIDEQIVQISNKSDEPFNHISAFADYSREVDNSDNNNAQTIKDEKKSIVEQQANENCPEDKLLAQEFGPIGSERRNSLATTDTPNPSFLDEPLNLEHNQKNNKNQLCQCWDFSLLMDGKVLHSCGELNNNSAIRPLDPAEIQEQDEEFGKSNYMVESSHVDNTVQQNQNDADKIIEIPTDVKTIITDTEIHKNSNEENNDKIEFIKIDDSQPMQDEGVIQTEDINVLVDRATASDGETALKDVCNSQSALGTIFNIIKSSILGNTNSEKSLEPVSAAESNENKTDIENVNVIKNSIAEIKDAINCIDSTDGIDSATIVRSSSNDKLDNAQICLEYNFEGIDEENAFLSVLENLQKLRTNKKIDEHVECAEPMESSENSNVDNINCITWKESPFPVDDLVFPSLDKDIIVEDVPKVDASTNTNYYDWNILYIGDTSDPSYRVIQARSRIINDNISLPKCEKPPRKLMLDKSSMTGDIFTRDGNPEIDNEQENRNRIPELMELFPHVPRDYLIDIFEKVRENFDWAVELLLEGIPEGIPDTLLKIPSSVHESVENMCVTPEIKTNIPASSIRQDHSYLSPDHEQENTNNQLDDIEFEQTLEDNIINPDTMKEMTGEETFDDTASTSTASVSRLESIDDEKSSDNDEIIELNLGFDCIKALEEKFGNFDIPEGFAPIVHIKKTLAEELYASWIESIYEQANTRDEQLEEMIAKDAQLARSLERKMVLEQAEAPVQQSTVPNLEQIMDMELALAKYENELKAKAARETPGDMAARLSFQMLHEAMPDIDLDAFNEILRAHNGNFKEAFDVIELNTGRVIAPTDTLKKQKLLMDKVKEENQNFKDKRSPTIVVRSETKDDKLKRAKDSREEAQRQLSLKIQNCNKAFEAYRKGCPSVAGYYSQMSRLHSRNMEVAHTEAANAYVEAISHDNEDTLDLHNLSVFEALVALEEFIDYRLSKLNKTNKRFIKLYIITGRGARSTNGISKLKPAVSQKLTSNNIKFCEVNPGCLKVTLYRTTIPTVN